MIPAVSRQDLDASWDCQHVLADLFHALSQPLTTLQCCLSGSLQRPQSAEGYRKNLQIALRQIELVVLLTSAIRELTGCDAGGGKPQPSDLNACVKEVVDDLLPIVKSARLKLSWTGSGGRCLVKLETTRLRQALYYTVEAAVSHARPRSAFTIDVARTKTEVRFALRISIPNRRPPIIPLKPGASDIESLRRRVTLAIARRTVESAAGRFQILGGLGHMTFSIHLPRFTQEPALPLARPSRRCG